MQTTSIEKRYILKPKTFVLDTNVLLHDYQSIFSFQNNEVIIPLGVIEEMDKFKKDNTETGRNARQVARILDGLRLKGVLTNGGVELENGGRLRVVFTEEPFIKQLPMELRNATVDNQILASALQESKREGSHAVVVTKDINLRIKAHAVGLLAEDYETDKVSFDHLYSGSIEIQGDTEFIDKFYRNKQVESPGTSCHPNQCVTIRNNTHNQQSAIGRISSNGDHIRTLHEIPREGFWGIVPRNREQRFALDLLADPDVKLVTLIGKAGTGKTLLAIAAGLHCVTELNYYSRLLVSRPVFPMGRDIGFLPGDVDEKLAPWMQPIYDNVDLLLREGGHILNKKNRGYQELKDLGILEVEPLTYIRGRSIPSQFIIVDEAQNLTPHEVKTIITRAGEGAKIILTGDPEQIDNPYVDTSSNGLTFVVERFKCHQVSGHITLYKGERSELAEAASNLL
jgi:PhoH-like ATPase